MYHQSTQNKSSVFLVTADGAKADERNPFQHDCVQNITAVKTPETTTIVLFISHGAPVMVSFKKFVKL